jgi:chlorobactene glucosyltransferase
MCLGTAFNAWTAPRLEDGRAGRRRETPADASSGDPSLPKVSLLIPARDEAENLAILLPMLSRIDYPGLEILVLDDGSTDGTAGRVRAGAGPARLLPGRPLPPGWLGKNWACAQLARAATGDILLFCDADVRMLPGAVAATVERMRGEGLAAFTCLPRQELATWPERAVIPLVMTMPVLAFLPLVLIPRHPMPALSIGCGQWFAFTRAAYRDVGGHAAVRREIVEDLALARRVKEKGMALGAALSTRLVSTRMYRDLPSLWSGFAKNLAVLTGTGWIRPPLVLGAFAVSQVLPWAMALAGGRAWLLPGLLWLAARLLAARTAREPAFGWLWSPVGSLLAAALAVRSWAGYRRRDVTWKGRNLEAAFGPDAAMGDFPGNEEGSGGAGDPGGEGGASAPEPAPARIEGRAE